MLRRGAASEAASQLLLLTLAVPERTHVAAAAAAAAADADETLLPVAVTQAMTSSRSQRRYSISVLSTIRCAASDVRVKFFPRCLR